MIIKIVCILSLASGLEAPLLFLRARNLVPINPRDLQICMVGGATPFKAELQNVIAELGYVASLQQIFMRGIPDLTTEYQDRNERV